MHIRLRCGRGSRVIICAPSSWEWGILQKFTHVTNLCRLANWRGGTETHTNKELARRQIGENEQEISFFIISLLWHRCLSMLYPQLFMSNLESSLNVLYHLLLSWRSSVCIHSLRLCHYVRAPQYLTTTICILQCIMCFSYLPTLSQPITSNPGTCFLVDPWSDSQWQESLSVSCIA